MLGDLEWDTLEIRRKKIRLTMMYKIINNLIDRGSGQLLFERYQTGRLSNWCWQGISNTGGLWKETVFVVICGC
jgi:hypothetical protein